MLHGRAAESGRLDSLFAAAAAGRGGALVVRGEPGVGKTALLIDATRRTTGARLLWTQGVESESPLAFAALHRLLHPVLGYLDRLPPAQAAALRVALGTDVGPAARCCPVSNTWSVAGWHPRRWRCADRSSWCRSRTRTRTCW